MEDGQVIQEQAHMSDGEKKIPVKKKKKKRTIFISIFQTCNKVWQSQFKPKEEVWQRMVGNYKDQKARRGHGFPLVQFHSNRTDNLCIFKNNRCA